MTDTANITTVIRNAVVVLCDDIRRVDIGMRGGKIDCIGEALTGYQAEIDADGCTVIPGMIDIHTHGAVRVDCNGASAADLQTLSLFFASVGVTGFYPSIICDAEERMIAATRTVSQARSQVRGAAILGCHLEGPFLSSAYKGAMPLSYLQRCNPALISAIAEAAGDCPLRMTVSPSAEGAASLIHSLVAQGVQVSLGHSDADYEQTSCCLRVGATSFTHVMNAMRPLDRREPGILGAALESDAACEFICDGLHLHPANIRLLLKSKGIGRLIGISDSIMATGLSDGTYRLGTQQITVTGDNAMLTDGTTRAGSLLTLHKALQNLMRFTGLPMEYAVLPFTRNPAELMGLDKQKGRIAVGMDADLTVLDARMNIAYTFVGQRLVYQSPDNQPGTQNNK